MLTRWRYKGVVLCLAILVITVAATAQGPRRGAQRQAARRNAINRGNRQAMRQRMMQRMQQQLEASETQWQAIEPKLQKVMELSRQVGGRRAGAMPGRLAGRAAQGQRRQRPDGQGRQLRANANRPVSAVQKASAELRVLLSGSDATPEQIQAKLTALRTVRQAAEKDLAQARDALKQVVTVKQEARLVLMGLLE